ncbi:MAG: FixH family protein [Alphaproteobacteria bacterium]
MNWTLVTIAAAAGAPGVPAAAQERMDADVSCTRVGQTMQYDCLLMLKGKLTGHPIQGAGIVVGADMPSMPMAYNIKPVKAEATGKPGEYRFRTLDMHGEWALKIRLRQAAAGSHRAQDGCSSRSSGRGDAPPADPQFREPFRIVRRLGERPFAERADFLGRLATGAGHTM